MTWTASELFETKTPLDQGITVSGLFTPKVIPYKADRFAVTDDMVESAVGERMESQKMQWPSATDIVDLGEQPEIPEWETPGETLTKASEAITPAAVGWYLNQIRSPGPITPAPKELYDVSRETSAQIPGGKAAQFAVDALKFPTIDMAAFAAHIADAGEAAVNDGNLEPAKTLIAGMAKDIAKVRFVTETVQYKAARETFRDKWPMEGFFRVLEFAVEHGIWTKPTPTEKEEMAHERETNVFWNAMGRGLVVAGILKGGAARVRHFENWFKKKGEVKATLSEELPGEEPIRPVSEKAEVRHAEETPRGGEEVLPEIEKAREIEKVDEGMRVRDIDKDRTERGEIPKEKVPEEEVSKAEVAPKDKKPWEMTKKEYVKRESEVLADYPDLALAKKQATLFEEITPEEYMGSGPRLFRSLGEELGPPPGRKPLPKVSVAKEPFRPGIGKYVRTESNYIGSIPGQKPKDITAARAIRRQIELEIEARIEEGLGVEYLNKEVFGKVDKVDRGKGKDEWRKVAEAMEQTELEIQGRSDLTANTKQAIFNFKNWFEKNRQLLIKDMRAEYSRFMSLEQVKKRVPDTWGIKEYLTHIFPGDYLIKIRGPKGKYETVGSAYCEMDAVRVAREDYALRTDVNPGDYRIVRKKILVTDPFRKQSADKARLIDDLTKATEWPRDKVIAIVQGKEYKTKSVYDPLKERKGAPGYSVDLPFIAECYNTFMARRRMGSKMRRKVAPLIDKLEHTGREDLGEYVRAVVSYSMGKQHPWSVAFDNTLSHVPGLKNVVRSHFLDRWTGKIKVGQRFLLLTASPKFHFLNRLQTYQTLLPVMEKDVALSFLKGQFRFTEAQRALLEKHNVRFVTGGKLEEAGAPRVGARLREKVSRKTGGIAAPETFNQELAWTVMYEHGKKIGLTDANAAKYAFARGNIYTQFAHFKADVPLLFHNPVATTLMPFRRFPIKTWEMLWDMTLDSVRPGKRGKGISGLTRFAAVHLLVGGVKATTGLVAKVGTVAYLARHTFGWKEAEMAGAPTELERQAYKKLTEVFGEQRANAVFWGLPALLDLDLSYSIQLIDRDYGASLPEELASEFLGPAVTIGMSAGKAFVSDKGPVASPWERAGRGIARRVAGLKWTLALEKVLTGDYDFKSPNGKIRFKGDLMDVIVQGMGGRPVEAAKMDIFIGAKTDMKELWDGYVDDAVRKTLAYDRDGIRGVLDEWNQLHPEIPMTFKDVKTRAKRRYKEMKMTAQERVFKQLPKALKKYFLEDLKEEE